jgi:hypothetical protein
MQIEAQFDLEDALKAPRVPGRYCPHSWSFCSGSPTKKPATRPGLCAGLAIDCLTEPDASCRGRVANRLHYRVAAFASRTTVAEEPNGPLHCGPWRCGSTCSGEWMLDTELLNKFSSLGGTYHKTPTTDEQYGYPAMVRREIDSHDSSVLQP